MKKYSLRQLYQEDPQAADELCWGRITPIGRRGFFKKAGLDCLQMALGANIVFARWMPSGLIPVALLDPEQQDPIPGKSKEISIINDLPLNAETPAHLLDDALTPNDLFFIRNNGLPPARSEISTKNWTLTINGESVINSLTLSLEQLKRDFKIYDLDITLECGGNGRYEFNPPTKGNQWTVGAVGCARFTGVRLKDVLQKAGIKSNAMYIGYYGADKHLSGDPSKVAISRGVPIAKALEEECLIAWAMNGEDLPLQNGFPLRLVIGGYPASCSGKWLTRIAVRNKLHDGSKMEAPSYMMPCHPVSPGTEVKDEDMCIIENMPVKSIVTYPKSGAVIKPGQNFDIRGHAWAGDRKVQKVEYSVNFGASWQMCELSPPKNRYAWQQFKAIIRLPDKGYYEVWAKATDDQGIAQPMLVPGWNPKGYLNNACHRIAIKVS